MHDFFNLRQSSRIYSVISALFMSGVLFPGSPASAQVRSDCQATGLVGDGVTDNTAALQKAIDDCAAAGRRLVLGGGSFLSGSLTLRSNLHLHIEKGATLQGSADPMAYDGGRIQKDNEGNEQPLKPFLSGEKLLNVKITGGGRIDGNGAAFWDARTYDRNYKGRIKPRPMPWFVVDGCRDFVLDGPTLANAPSFTFTLESCDGAKLTNFRIENPFDSPNTYGVQINDSVDVKVANCDISTGDDAVVLKGRRRHVERVEMSSCHIRSDDGALKFGTNSRTGVANSVFRDITITDSRFGIALFMIDGGEHRNNVFERITIESSTDHKRNYPIFVDIDKRRADSKLGGIVDTLFSDITIRTRGQVLITGQQDAPIRGLTLRNVNIAVAKAQELTKTGPKPGGNRNRARQNGVEDFSEVNATVVFAHVEDLRADNLVVTGDLAGRETSVATQHVKFRAGSGLKPASAE